MCCSFNLHPGLIFVQRQSVPLGLLDQLHYPITMGNLVLNLLNSTFLFLGNCPLRSSFWLLGKMFLQILTCMVEYDESGYEDQAIIPKRLKLEISL